MLFICVLIAIISLIVLLNKDNKTKLKNLEEANKIKHEAFLKEIEQNIVDRKLKNNEIIDNINTTYANYESIDFDLAGLFYRSNLAKEKAELLFVGEKVNLRSDQNNEYDSTAVKVIYDKSHIGFVPARISEKVTNFIKTHKDINTFVMENDEVEYFNNGDILPIISLKVFGIKK